MPAIISHSLLYCYLLLGVFAIKPHAPASPPHPLHVSTTDMNYNGTDHQLEVTCTIFTDDFESALAKQFNTKTDLTKADMHKAMDVLVKNYLTSHLHVKSGNNAVALNYLGYEVDREAVNVFLESTAIPAVKKAIVDVSLLHNLYNDQINIVHITVNGQRKSTKLDYPDTRVVQDF